MKTAKIYFYEDRMVVVIEKTIIEVPRSWDLNQIKQLI